MFCALCNGVLPTGVAIDVSNSAIYYDGGISQVYSFSGLLRSSYQDHEEEKNTDTHCNSGFIYDKLKVFFIKVRKMAKIRNRFNQVPHLTQDTNGKVTSSQ